MRALRKVLKSRKRTENRSLKAAKKLIWGRISAPFLSRNPVQGKMQSSCRIVAACFNMQCFALSRVDPVLKILRCGHNDVTSGVMQRYRAGDDFRFEFSWR